LPRKLLKQDPILSAAINDSNDENDETVELVGGGFGGGPGQMAHAATNYAAVLALCILAGSGDCPAAYTLLEQRRQGLYIWLLSLKQRDTGSFRMQHDGEIDVRATYCVMAVAKLLHICTDTLTVSAMNYVSACQTYEGGFGGEPFTEAHGGYTFCATAAVQLLNGWSWNSAAPFARPSSDGIRSGFNGRANKPSMGVTVLARWCWPMSRPHDNENHMKQPWLSDLRIVLLLVLLRLQLVQMMTRHFCLMKVCCNDIFYCVRKMSTEDCVISLRPIVIFITAATIYRAFPLRNITLPGMRTSHQRLVMPSNLASRRRTRATTFVSITRAKR
jgi:hypothetical protein